MNLRNLKYLICSLVFVLLIVDFTSVKGQVLPIKQGKKWGLITPGGDLVLPPEYDAIPYVNSDHAVYRQKWQVRLGQC